MLVPFNTLHGNSKIWIYQSSRVLSNGEQHEIAGLLGDFLSSWTAHQAELKTGFEIKYNLFVIIGVDENYNSTSGCSIDKQVNFMKKLGDEMNIDFFNRLRLASIVDDKIEVGNLNEFTRDLHLGKVKDEVLVFNNLVTTIDEYRNSWKQPVRDSWVMLLN